jgi:hypothetical protein
MQAVQTIGDGVGDGPLGVAYHPQQNLMYLPWQGTTEVRVYDTTTFAEVSRISAGSLQFTNGAFNRVGQARLTRSGETLLVTTAYGIRYVPLPAQLPVILTQPKAAAVAPDKPATFRVKAYSGYALHYQWQKDGEDIPGATGEDYTFVVGAESGGQYRVAVMNDAGTVYSEDVLLRVTKHDPDVIWANPPEIIYGTPLGGIHLNATTATAGTLTYDPPVGTRLNSGLQPLRAVFVPADLDYYEQTTNTVYINVLKRSLTFSLGNTNRQYGLPDPVFAYTCVGLVPGDSLSDIDVLPVSASTATDTSPTGNYAVNFSGGSDNNYYFVFGTGTLTVTKRTVAFSLTKLTQGYTGTPRPVTVTTVPDGVPVNITYNGSTTAPTVIGSYPVSVSINNANYQGSTNGTLVISKGTAAITWSNPVPVRYGTALNGAQLNASASINGIYAYTPANGAVLNPGIQTLTLVFTPLDSVNYNRSTNTVSLQVNPGVTHLQMVPQGQNNEFRFDFNGLNGQVYAVEISSNLVDWVTLTNFTATTGAWTLNDLPAAQPRRFYRIVPKP